MKSVCKVEILVSDGGEYIESHIESHKAVVAFDECLCFAHKETQHQSIARIMNIMNLA